MAISHEIIAVTKIHWYCQKLHIGKDPGTEERFVARGGDEDQMQHCLWNTGHTEQRPQPLSCLLPASRTPQFWGDPSGSARMCRNNILPFPGKISLPLKWEITVLTLRGWQWHY